MSKDQLTEEAWRLLWQLVDLTIVARRERNEVREQRLLALQRRATDRWRRRDLAFRRTAVVTIGHTTGGTT